MFCDCHLLFPIDVTAVSYQKANSTVATFTNLLRIKGKNTTATKFRTISVLKEVVEGRRTSESKFRMMSCEIQGGWQS